MDRAAPRSTQLDLQFGADHPAFDGHFPGNPLLPGVALIDATLAHLASLGWIDPANCEISSFKFTSAVRPRDRVRMQAHCEPDGSLRIRLTCGDRTIAIGIGRARIGACGS